jgi:hypothetical protein
MKALGAVFDSARARGDQRRVIATARVYLAADAANLRNQL